MTSIAYADTTFLRQEQLQEQKIQHAISASRSTAQLTKPIAFEQAVEVDSSIQDLSSTAFFVREIVVDDNLEKFSFLEDMMLLRGGWDVAEETSEERVPALIRYLLKENK